MNFERSESMNLQVTAPGEAGQTLRLAILTCSFQPGKRVSVSVELQKDYDALAHGEQLNDALDTFMTHVWERCAKNYLPVPKPATAAE